MANSYFLTFGAMDERANVAPGGRKTFPTQAKAKAAAKSWIERGQKRVCVRQELPSGRSRPVQCVTGRKRKPKKAALGCGCGG